MGPLLATEPLLALAPLPMLDPLLEPLSEVALLADPEVLVLLMAEFAFA